VYWHTIPLIRFLICLFEAFFVSQTAKNGRLPYLKRLGIIVGGLVGQYPVHVSLGWLVQEPLESVLNHVFEQLFVFLFCSLRGIG